MEKKKVKVVEIGPRDGFQNVKDFIETDSKLAVIDGLVRAGVQKIQVTSFVSPRAIPQMADAFRVANTAVKKYPNVNFFALVPNFHGAKEAVSAGLKEVNPVMSLSVTHNLANVKKTHEQSLDEIKRIRDEIPELEITQDIATSFGCPFEGDIPIKKLLELIEKLRKIGIHQFTLCDTTGIAYPTLVRNTFQAVKKEFPEDIFNVHIHDTRNMGLLNSLTALEYGADSIQTAVGGLGGCPFAPGASGNTSSEDLVYMLNKCGFDTQIDFDKLLSVAKFVKSKINGNFSGHHINIPEKPCVITQE